MNRTPDSHIPGAAVRAAILALVSGCGAPADRPIDEPESVMVVHTPNADEWLFGPSQADEPMHLIYLPLAREGPDGEIEGQLIRSWERSDDYRHWTIRMRSDVRWHDGVPVTAGDVAFTVDLLRHPDVALIPPEGFSITVIDDTTYTVDIATSDYRTVTPLDRTHRGIPLPRHLLEDLDPAEFFDWEFWLEPVGNGPYRYVRHVPRTMVELEANPDFYLGRPAVDRVILKFSGDNRLAELQSEQVDFSLYVEWSDLLNLADDDRFRSYWTKDTWVYVGILWNVREGPLADARVRRALTLALDRAGLQRALNLPPETPLIESVFTERQYWRGTRPDPLPHDPEEARAVLTAAGWGRDGEGVWERDGVRLAATALVLREDAIIETAAVLVQDQLRDFGVELDLVPLEPAVLRERRDAGDFEAIIGEVGTAPSWMARQFGSESYLGYTSPRIQSLLAEADAAVDPDEKDAVYAELGAILREDLPVTALFPDYEMHVAHRRLRGLSSPWRAVPLRNMEDVTIDDDGGP